VCAEEGLCNVLMWDEVHDDLARRPPGTVLPFARGVLPDPRALGARESIGLPRGQGADLRFPPDGACRGLHVQAFPGRWEAHLDQVHPECDLIGHLRRDAPTALAALVTGATLAFIAAAARYRSARPAWTR
jgi:hypothetical protein